MQSRKLHVFSIVRARGYKTFFMLNSTEHEILTFMSGKNGILGLSEP